jgi:hypothetical protein
MQPCFSFLQILRRGSYEEQLLFLVKHRKGHKCATAWIVVCCVIWEGVPPHFADNLYDTLVYKLNRFGIPTTRRSDTNEQRSCACQGVDPDTCGAAYSFGCAWSMFFNGCKYARSRNVRKFRLTEEHEVSSQENVKKDSCKLESCAIYSTDRMGKAGTIISISIIPNQ